jgi:hypothetical protein
LIEQTELIVTAWEYKAPGRPVGLDDIIENYISLETMKKTAATKKGVAFRFTTIFIFESETILEYVGEDSYVIDFEDRVDKNEVTKMIRNSYSKFTEKFEFKKIGTVLHNRSIRKLDESAIDLDAILPLLV